MTRTASTTDRPRQPKGVPVGGQWTSRSHGEAEVDLSGLSGLTATPDQVLALAHEAAGNEARRYPGRIDLDDLAQDTVAEYFARRSRNLEAQANGDEAAAKAAVLVNHPGPYLQRIAHGLAQRQVTGVSQSYERTAVKEYLDAKRALEQQLGTELTAEQEDSIAEAIIEDYPPGRRPKPGFHRSPVGREVSIDDSDDQDRGGALRDASMAADAVTTAGADTDTDADADDRANRLLDTFESADASQRAEMRRNAWTAVAQIRSAPDVAADSLSESAAAGARRAIAEHGGVVSVAKMWADDAASTKGEQAACDALFAPFGDDLSFDQQATIVETVISLRDSGAGPLFDSAIGAATRKRKKT